jgi:hypothetical protein
MEKITTGNTILHMQGIQNQQINIKLECFQMYAHTAAQ